jgi:hypothetical protein
LVLDKLPFPADSECENEFDNTHSGAEGGGITGAVVPDVPRALKNHRELFVQSLRKERDMVGRA